MIYIWDRRSAVPTNGIAPFLRFKGVALSYFDEVDVPESSGQRVSFLWTPGIGASDCAFQSWHLQIAQNGAFWPR